VKPSVVADSSCLIGLERIGYLNLLPSLFDPILIPPAVAREFGVVLPWLQIVTPSNQALADALKLIIDDGEAEAIALAKERGLIVILDDLKARTTAESMGVKFTGLAKILLRAKQEGLIPQLKPLLDALETSQFYLGQALKQKILRLAGE
jgi:predicted nucleic acid-binding protein